MAAQLATWLSMKNSGERAANQQPAIHWSLRYRVDSPEHANTVPAEHSEARMASQSRHATLQTGAELVGLLMH